MSEPRAIAVSVARAVRGRAARLALTAAGAALFHMRRRKQVVVIVSSMRAGSTLLKALLAAAADVSHLPEQNLRPWSSAYETYYRLWRLSPAAILVIKKPCPYWSTVYPRFPRLPRGARLRVVAVVREPVPTILSLERMNAAVGRVPLTRDELIAYWCRTYDAIRAGCERAGITPYVVRYETLVTDPVTVTRDLFRFIGSARRTGTRAYARPPDFDWQWGNDDAGDKIRSLAVQRDTPARDADLEERVARHVGVAAVRRAFGLVSADVVEAV